MSLGDILTSRTSPTILSLNKCPVRFTTDFFEYVESKEFLNQKMFRKQRHLFELFYSRDENNQRIYNECVQVLGMRSGKSLGAGSWVGTFHLQELFGFEEGAQTHFGLSTMSTIFISAVASSEEQTERTIFGYLRNTLLTSNYWITYHRWLIDRAKKGGVPINRYLVGMQPNTTKMIYPDKNIQIIALNSNSSSIAGTTSYCTLFDEIARLPRSKSDGYNETGDSSSADAVYYTLSRATKTFKNEANIMVVSSPLYVDDMAIELLLTSKTFICGDFGKPFLMPLYNNKVEKVDNRVGFHYATWEYNETYTESDFESDKQKNYAAYLRDFGGIPQQTINPYIDLPEYIDRSLIPDPNLILIEDINSEDHIVNEGETIIKKYISKKVVRATYDKITPRFIACDAGHSNCNFIIAMGHPELVYADEAKKFPSYKTVVDFILALEPDKEAGTNVDFDSCLNNIIIELNRYFNIVDIWYDRWQSLHSVQILNHAKLNANMYTLKKDDYNTYKNRVYRGLFAFYDIDLKDRPKAASLELKKLRKYKEIVDHPPGGHSDIAVTLIRLDTAIYKYEIAKLYSDKKGVLAGGVSLTDVYNNDTNTLDVDDLYKGLMDKLMPNEENGVTMKPSVWHNSKNHNPKPAAFGKPSIWVNPNPTSTTGKGLWAKTPNNRKHKY